MSNIPQTKTTKWRWNLLSGIHKTQVCVQFHSQIARYIYGGASNSCTSEELRDEEVTCWPLLCLYQTESPPSQRDQNGGVSVCTPCTYLTGLLYVMSTICNSVAELEFNEFWQMNNVTIRSWHSISTAPRKSPRAGSRLPTPFPTPGSQPASALAVTRVHVSGLPQWVFCIWLLSLSRTVFDIHWSECSVFCSSLRLSTNPLCGHTRLVVVCCFKFYVDISFHFSWANTQE